MLKSEVAELNERLDHGHCVTIEPTGIRGMVYGSIAFVKHGLNYTTPSKRGINVCLYSRVDA
jgi:hypothetical protein